MSNRVKTNRNFWPYDRQTDDDVEIERQKHQTVNEESLWKQEVKKTERKVYIADQHPSTEGIV